MTTPAKHPHFKFTDNGCFYTVRVSARGVEAFNDSWPCSRLPEKAISFQFDKRNGDLVNIRPDSSRFDGPELVALSEDAQNWGATQLA